MSVTSPHNNLNMPCNNNNIVSNSWGNTPPSRVKKIPLRRYDATRRVLAVDATTLGTPIRRRTSCAGSRRHNAWDANMTLHVMCWQSMLRCRDAGIPTWCCTLCVGTLRTMHVKGVCLAVYYIVELVVDLLFIQYMYFVHPDTLIHGFPPNPPTCPKPAPVPVKTRTRRCGYEFPQEQVRVAEKKTQGSP